MIISIVGAYDREAVQTFVNAILSGGGQLNYDKHIKDNKNLGPILCEAYEVRFCAKLMKYDLISFPPRTNHNH